MRGVPYNIIHDIHIMIRTAVTNMAKSNIAAGSTVVGNMFQLQFHDFSCVEVI